MEVAFRITVLDPPRGVVFRLQRGRSELLAPSSENPSAIVFDFTLRVEPGAGGGPPRLLGPFAQGPPASRFVYVSSGRHAGQVESCWDRRAKVPLTTVDASLIQQAAARSGAVIEAQIAGTGRDGGPACATVKLVSGWRVLASS